MEESIAGYPASSDFAARARHKSMLTTPGTSGQLIDG